MKTSASIPRPYLDTRSCRAPAVGRHEVSLQGVWRSGLSGSLDVDGRSWALSPRAESGVWLTWRKHRRARINLCLGA